MTRFAPERGGEPAEPVEGPFNSAPNQRSFSLNSEEFYEAVCPREDRPWIPNGALPREPRVWEREVIVEKRGR